MSLARSTSLVAAVLLVAGLSVEAQARERAGLFRRVSLQPEVLPSPDAAPVPPSAQIPGAYQKLVPSHPVDYSVRYKHHCTLRRTCCGSCAPRKIVVDVQDPCCNSVEVPVCIPGCCKGDPHVSTGRDVLGRCSYTYEWGCGYKVDVVFRARGDIVVHSWGR